MALSLVSTWFTGYLASQGLEQKLASLGQQPTVQKVEGYTVDATTNTVTVEAVTVS